MSTPENAIRSVVAAMTAAFNDHDAERQASFFAEDADFVSARGLRWRGRSEIQRGLSELFRAPLRSASLETLDVEVRVVRDDLALAHVRNRLTGRTDARGQHLPPHEELSIRVFVHMDDLWLMAAFQNTVVEQAPPADA